MFIGGVPSGTDSFLFQPLASPSPLGMRAVSSKQGPSYTSSI